MRRNLLLFLSLSVAITLHAQPVIQNDNNLPSPGFTFPISFANVSSVGSPGANQVWDFSNLPFLSGAIGTIIAPSTSPLAGAYPTSNFAMQIDPLGEYSFFSITADKMETLAWRVNQLGGGSVYTPNPKTILKFPFNFNESVTDSWQEIGGSPETVIVSYDGYGKFKAPKFTYDNVVRIKNDYGGGTVDYNWFLLNPLAPLALYVQSEGRMYYFNLSSVVSSVSEKDNLSNQLSVYPNPATDYVNISRIPKGADIRITDIGGKVIYKTTTTQDQLKINTTGFLKGIYLIQVSDKGKVFSSKLFINK